MNKKILIIIGVVLITIVIVTGFSDCMKSKYVKYDDIDDVEYAKPTEYAKNFDIEGYISKLPEVEYKKIDYPVKETYTYKFNDYEMTIDIPEGFEVKEIPLEKNPKIIDSTSIEDSCKQDGLRSIKRCGDELLLVSPIMTVSSKLEISQSNVDNAKYSLKDKKIFLSFKSSQYKGINNEDAFIRYIVPGKSYDEEHLKIETIYNKKYKNKYGLFLVSSPRNRSAGYGILKLTNDRKYIFNIIVQCDKDNAFNKDLYFSILDSMKIEEK